MQEYSFYYRENLNLKTLFPKAIGFSLLFPDDNIIIEDGVMRLKDPSAFNPARIHNIVRVYPNKYDYFKIQVSICCWIEDEKFKLKEITRFKRFNNYFFIILIRKFIRKIGLLPSKLHLFSSESLSFFSINGKLVRFEENTKRTIGRLPHLESPIYYEFLPIGEEAFFRTGTSIYKSTSCMRDWSLIYKGKRAIKDSMVWIQEEKALIFIEYSPGLEPSKHRILKYFIETGELKTVLSFYSPGEHESTGNEPYCRHIHVIQKDPYTSHIYVGVGDSDDESAIFLSTNHGNSFTLVGHGSQMWRTLSFIFTKEAVFWNTDSPDPQFIHGINRSQLSTLPLSKQEILHFPVFNGASWNTVYDKATGIYIMSSSCEGMLFDDKSHILGLFIKDGFVNVYHLFEDFYDSEYKYFLSNKKFQQLFIQGKDIQGVYWFYDIGRYCNRKFVLKHN